MNIRELLQAYQEGTLTPVQYLEEKIFPRLEAFSRTNNPAWITLRSTDDMLAEASLLEDRARRGDSLPLYGIPYAVKDNIDVEGLPTTAACPDYSYLPGEDAHAVALLRQAGALLIGKTNLDQFATGLVGARSPYGSCHSVFHPDYISGGSSSGSAVVVAAQLVAFSLGTDTAGSGRVPAAFNQLVGYKATRGRVSTRGVVPACRSLDCVTVFAPTIADASLVMDIIGQPDPLDPFSRSAPPRLMTRPRGSSQDQWTFGIPSRNLWQFFGDEEAENLYQQAIETMIAAGGTPCDIDDQPLREAALLLYTGPWVAERTVAIESFLRTKPEAIHPVVRDIIRQGDSYSATDTFRALYQLEEFRRQIAALWNSLDCLLLPTAPIHPTIAEVLADPVQLNSRLGTYTNFVNLLDLTALALPSGQRTNGCPFGITLIGPAWSDHLLETLGLRFQSPETPPSRAPQEGILLAVVGAHLRGQPLHPQLLDCGAIFVETTQTAPRYRLFALPTNPPKPGLLQSNDIGAQPIEVEIYRMTPTGLGQLLRQVPPPLTIGTIQLASGANAKGFLVESSAIDGAHEITHHRSWRAYLG